MTKVEQALLRSVAQTLGIALPSGRRSKARKSSPSPVLDRKLAYRNAVKSGFKRRGVELTLNAETNRFDNVLPYKEWAEAGRQVRKGEKSIRGLFHVSQTDATAPAVASA